MKQLLLKNMKFKNGLMLILIAFSMALGGYVSAEPQTKPPGGENTFVNYIIGTEVNTVTDAVPGNYLLAQADLTDQTHADTVGSTVINTVTTILPIKVDTVENIGDIIDSGTYLVKSVHKGMTLKEILELIFGILGLVAGVYYYVRHKTLKTLVSKGDLAGAQKHIS